MDKELEGAVSSGDGDLDEYMVQIRDGNHRAFGAIAAGEPYVWIALSENQLLDINEQVDRMAEITRKIMKIKKYETIKYIDGKIVDIDRASE